MVLLSRHLLLRILQTKITSVKYADGKLTATSTENMVDGSVKLAITIANNNATATVYVNVTLN